MAEVAEAVGFLHRHGIVHFDLVRNVRAIFQPIKIPEAA